MIEMDTGRLPRPGPEVRRRRLVPEEERRQEDMAAVRHPEILQLAGRCIVDDESMRADATEMAAAVEALQVSHGRVCH